MGQRFFLEKDLILSKDAIIMITVTITNIERRGNNMNLKGTKTEANLQTTFAGESIAKNKYTYFASKAKEGWICVQIANIFEETAANEKKSM